MKKSNKSTEPNVYISDNLLLFGTICAIIIPILLNILRRGRTEAMEWWVELLINSGVSLLASVGMSIFIYYKYLKKIPEETEKKINKLLNDRLSYEATNHNAVISKLDNDLNPRNSTLEKQHSQIYKKVEKVHDMILEDKADKKSAFNNMSEEQRKISYSIENLSHLSKVMETLINENTQLKEKVFHLEQNNRQHRNPERRPQHKQHYEQELSL